MTGFDGIVLDWIRLEWIRLDLIRLDCNGFDWDFEKMSLKDKVPTSKCVLTSKLISTSKLVPRILLKLLTDGATSNILYQSRCDDKIDMIPNFPHKY